MKDLVLITGGGGFIGFKTLLTALEAGYNVRAVIRKPEQAEKLKAHAKIAPFVEKLEFAVLPDLTKDGAFDNVLSDVTAILHVASPLAIQTDNYDRDIFDPAIQIGTSLLHSALKAPTVKRVIITSSSVTLVPFEWLSNPDRKIYTAKDLNPTPTRSVSSSLEAYWSSKAFARAAVHDFIKTQKPHFETIQMLPGVVIGPDDRASCTADLLNNTPDWKFRMSPILGVKQDGPLVGIPVHVADVAKAHVDAIKPTIPGNADYVLCTESPDGCQWDAMIETAKKNFPDRVGSEELPLGGTLPTLQWNVDARETERVFEWKFVTYDATIKEMVGQYLDLFTEEKKGGK